jgi:starch-binding outer membrane protein, SusD/RagB family
MKKIAYIFSLSLGLLLLSCESFLDEAPRNQIDPDRFYVSEADNLAALTGIYYHLMHDDVFGYGVDDFFGMTTDLTTPSRALAGRIFWAFRWDESSVEVRSAWRRLYMAVNDANVTISKVASSEMNQQAKDEFVAEAVYLRAFTYFYLTAVFGDVPYITQPTINTESFGQNISLGRTPANEIRQNIIQDLTEIEGKLPAAPRTDHPQRATRWAAKCLKLKTYLWLKDYANALATAQDIVNNSGHILLPNYEDVFRADNEFNKEIIFQLDYLFNEFPTERHSKFQPRAQDENPAGGPLPAYFDGFNNYTLFRSFEKTFAPNDLRRKSNAYKMLPNGTPLFYTYVVKQWRTGDARSNSGLNYQFFRFADVLLELAEAENELNGPTPVAYNAINKVRARAGLNPLENLSQQQLREAIKQERSWELVGEGTHRKMDLLRWNELEKALKERLALEQVVAQPHKNHLNNLKTTLQYYAPHKNLLPVPFEEIVLNPKLTQNAGYKQ